MPQAVQQPFQISVSIPYDLRASAATDDISKSINYSAVSKRILASVEYLDDPKTDNDNGVTAVRPRRPLQFRSLEQLADRIFTQCFDAFPEIGRMTLDVVKPRALPYADAVRILSVRARDGSRPMPERFSILRLACNVLVGLNQCEREDRQLVCFDIDVDASPVATSTVDVQPRQSETEKNGDDDDSSGGDLFMFDIRRMAKDIRQVSTFAWTQRALFFSGASAKAKKGIR
jgi:dihydroneopterin aldolase/2-amino-4-hydroxy-6-hydroxymethyldihydropteridine diphosphokinase/dihydropteroate synthase